MDPARSDAEQLRDHLQLLTHWPTWADAASAGVELVDHPDTIHGRTFHLANGDAVYPTDGGWEVLDQVRAGTPVTSGTMTRIHNPGIDPTARIHPTAHVDPTARVEAGATVARHATIGRHAHVGRDSHIGDLTHIGDGAYIGTTTTVRQSVRIGEGAVVGTRSDLGSTSSIGAGTQLPQHTTLDPSTTVGAGTQPTSIPQQRGGQLSSAANLVERLTTFDRG